MNKIKVLSLIIAAIVLMNLMFISVYANDLDETGFYAAEKYESEDLGATVYLFIHKKTGAQVVWVDNGKEKCEFALCFKTPPTDSKGANHVLEHALLCGSEKYPTKNIMHYIQEGTSSLILNGMTDGDYTYYLISTSNETEYYNTMDVYLNGIFHPLLLSDENIFRQQGIRLEYDNGRAKYNGVVYNELRLKNLNTEDNSLNFTADKLYRGIYGDTPPSFSPGGELEWLKQLTYEDLINVYNTYYVPSNSMTYISGRQDINKTLKLFDSFFSQYDSKKPIISFEDTKKIPDELITEYNITADTKTVDIGFMHSGVMLDSPAKELYAREIIFDLIKNKMDEINENNYVSGGKAGGMMNMALLASEIPMEKKDEIISKYFDVLAGFMENGFDKDELNNKIEEYMEYKGYSFYSNQENIFDGLMYQNDPLAFTALSADEKYLKEHSEYFTEILKKYFTENPYKKIVVSGNGSFGSEDIYVNVSREELDKIKEETGKFNLWADEKDKNEIIEKIPFLTLDEVKNEPAAITPVYENKHGISFYNSVSSEGDSASLFFPIDINNDELMLIQLMYGFADSQNDNTNLYFGMLPMESYTDRRQFNIQFFININGEEKLKTLNSALSFFNDANTWSAEALAEYIKSAPDAILARYYDPYYVSYELKQSSLSETGKFYSNTMGALQQGSIRYYNFLKNMNWEDIPKLSADIKALADKILDCKPMVEYVGESGYEEFKDEVIKIYKDKEERANAGLLLPIGYNCAATVTSLEDSNHFMLAGKYDQDEYSGKLKVLGNVLTSKYILPQMRGKYGAYGANISFYNNTMTAAVAGLSDIDLAIKIWEGMGNYLRNLDMTQKELDAIKVSAINELEKWSYEDLKYGVQSALSGKTAEYLQKTRREILETSVEDLRGYADFVDKLTAQNHIFAVLGKNAADNSDFDFAYYANHETLNITPMLTKKPKAYIQGKSENIFAPDELLTRGEIAVIVSRLTADRREAKGPSPFADVCEDDWFCNAVVSLWERGIINGYETGEFKPQNPITRGEFAAILSQFIFDEYSAKKTDYLDISEDDWFYIPFSKMIEKGFIKGYDDNTYRPDRFITRAEAVVIINRMLKLNTSAAEENPFIDVDETHWAYNDILMAVSR